MPSRGSRPKTPRSAIYTSTDRSPAPGFPSPSPGESIHAGDPDNDAYRGPSSWRGPDASAAPTPPPTPTPPAEKQPPQPTMTAGQTERLLRVIDDRLDIVTAELGARGETAGSSIDDLRWVAEKLDELTRHRVDDFDRRSSALRDAEFRVGMKRNEVARSDDTRAARERDLRERIVAVEQAAQHRLTAIEQATTEASAALEAERRRLAVAREKTADASASLENIKERSRAMVDELAERQKAQLADFEEQLASRRADAEAVIAKGRLGLQTERQQAAAAIDVLARQLHAIADAMDSAWTVRIKGGDHRPRLRKLEEVARALSVTLGQS